MEVTERKPTTVVNLPHPLRPDAKEICAAEFLAGETLGAYISRNGIQVARGPVNVWHNGSPVPQHLWTRLIPRSGDFIVIRAKMQGGGGGNKILRTVAMVALVVAGAAYGGVLGAALGFTGTTAAAIGSSIIMIGGSLLINALLPPPKPTLGQLGGSKYESSPTYAISGGRNRSRQWEPMALVFGVHKIVPDLGANYYTEYVGDTQYLNQVFHFGLQAGQMELTDFKIGQTPLENYQDVQVQISGEDGKLSMFPGNVDTIAGFTLESGVVNSRTTADDVTSISVDLAAQLFNITDAGTFTSVSVDLRVQYRRVGDEEWIDAGFRQDAIYATHYWSLVQSVYAPPGPDAPAGDYYYTRQVGYGSTNPADHTPGEVVIIRERYCSGEGNARTCVSSGTAVWKWVPHPNALGQPWTGIAPDPVIGYSTSPGVRLTGARQEPTRKTVTWPVERGKYEIRVWKESPDVKTSRRSNEAAVSQIRATQVDEADYTGQLRVAVRIKATSQLNGAIDELSAIAHAHAPEWDGDHFEVQETRNPASWFLWFARGKTTERGRVYGGGLVDEQIDFDSIVPWWAWCKQKGLTFDYVLDRKTSVAEVLQIIARAGRASPTWQSGKLGVIWDAADLPVVAMFGPFNIRAGSFEIAYMNDGTVDEVVLNYANRDRDFQMDEVRVRVPGATTTNNPLQLDMEGVTETKNAGAEANLLAASQVWHRRRVTWETDIEGYVATRGDVVSISHDLTVWGYSGRLMAGSHGAGDGELPVMVLSQAVTTGGSGTVLLRAPDGQMKTVAVTSEAGESVDRLTIATDLDGFPMPGDPGWEDANPLDWAWQFDPLATPGRRFKIIGVEPVADGVRFTAIDDDPEYYASEYDPYSYTPPRDGALLAGVVLTITGTEEIVSVVTDQIRLRLGWVLTNDAPCLVTVVVNGQQRYAQQIVERSLDVQVATGDVVDVTVLPRRFSGAGEPKRATFTIQGLSAPLPALTGLTSVFRDGFTVLVWSRVVDPRQPSYEVRLGPTWADARTVGRTDSLEMLAVGNGRYWAAAMYRLNNGTVIYGPPDTLQISGASLVRNVLVEHDEAPAWAGELAGAALVYEGMLTLAPAGDILAAEDVLGLQDVLWYGGVAGDGSYTADEVVDIGYVAPVRIGLDIEYTAIKLDEDILSVADVLAINDVLSGSNRQFVGVQPQIRYAQIEDEWTDWRDYVPGLLNARYFQVRLLLSTQVPTIVPFVSAYLWTVDVPDLIQHAEGVMVPIGGVDVVYEKPFHARPNVQITIIDAQEGDQARLTDESEEGFNLSISNNGVAVERRVNWLSQGY